MEDLRSGIEHLKQAKAHMSEANGIMSDHISKLKSLEEENARLKADYETALEHEDRLKAELDDWKGNAEGFEPDAYMKLPLDADGVPVRIGDEVFRLVDGMKLYVSAIEFTEEGCLIMAKTSPNLLASGYTGNTLRHKKPEPPDSWEKLRADLMLVTSAYCDEVLHRDSSVGVPYEQRAAAKADDVIARAKKLAGIEEEAER